MTNKDRTGGERQTRLRKARKEWLKEHGYKSSEGLIGALMRGDVVLQIAQNEIDMEQPRNRIYNGIRFACVGVPTDASGNEMKKFLRRKEKSGDCRIDWDGPSIHHCDGKIYIEIKIFASDAEHIASEALQYMPGNEKQTIAGPCQSCNGTGCVDCGYNGVQALY